MLENKEGQKVPEVSFEIMEQGKWKTVTSQEIFKGKKVVLFALPGAFTPTCSSSHLPRYNQLASVFKQKGVDQIVCLSVNDTFVMNSWKKDQKAENIGFLPDGNGLFSAGMGMLVDKANLGFGKRSWRYSMLVDDGVIKKMFIEEEKPGDPFDVSDADTMLDFVAPGEKAPPAVSLFTKPGCPFCAKAKQMLKDKGLPYEEIELGNNATSLSLQAVTGQSSVPQVYINGEHIGDSNELEKFLS